MGGIRFNNVWFEENNYSKTNAESPDGIVVLDFWDLSEFLNYIFMI